MERVNFNYSMKNIPIPSKNVYLTNLIFKLESCIKRIQWKTYSFEKRNEIDDATDVNNSRFNFVLTMNISMHLKRTHLTWYIILSLKELILYYKINLIKILRWLIKTHCYLFLQTKKWASKFCFSINTSQRKLYKVWKITKIVKFKY